MTTYKVGGEKVLYDSTFDYRGKTFHVHRPVGTKGPGWQVSLDGVWLHTNKDENLKPKVVKNFTQKCDDAWSNDSEFWLTVNRVIGDNRG